MPIISLIAALDNNRGIGFERKLPWPEPIPADWENLFEVTAGKKMIMGRKSYDDPHRISSPSGNYVITSQKNYEVEENFEIVNSIEEALEKCADQKEVFILGGQQIFEQSLQFADKLVLTHVHADFPADTFFPEFSAEDFVETDTKNFEIGEGTPYPLTISTYIKQ
ncbi:MAG: dihydrofolate reductase [Spirosomaceae bacterium]|nr:dihydrofolate reductase [Spirosomataceae bacterium]